ncbi:hypothetical protein GCM10010124_33570 [Pilimelia terevasa]|uniref:Uncharacterized protein n=1 Tax=Pilimelia terevasa TaxID=53372 RepID=A0A8J3FKA7_9ACTN|nr:hypothetical protein [Pilimelia terevasa]GGK38048.1 hypothetical protein GCM10010124_33570 [Pilimelia terevasa]
MAVPRRVLAAAGVAAALAGPAAPAAAAGPAAVLVREVVFDGGGLLGLRCAATPDQDAVTVTAESTLRVRNETGHRATLVMDDEERGEVPAGRVAEVLFHRGPVELTLRPHCVVTRQESLRVQVVGQPVGEPAQPAPVPLPSPVPTPDAPAPASPSPQPPPVPRAAAGTPHPLMGLGPGGAAGAAEVPVLDEALAADGHPAAEPMAAVEPLADRGAVTLLGLVAFVCIAGVSIGAFRVILAQRSIRGISP